MTEIIYKDESYQVQGAAFEVYKEMGNGFLEAVYQECMERELELRNIPFDAQRLVSLQCKGKNLKQTYKPDLICFDKNCGTQGCISNIERTSGSGAELPESNRFEAGIDN